MTGRISPPFHSQFQLFPSTKVTPNHLTIAHCYLQLISLAFSLIMGWRVIMSKHHLCGSCETDVPCQLKGTLVAIHSLSWVSAIPYIIPTGVCLVVTKKNENEVILCFSFFGHYTHVSFAMASFFHSFSKQILRCPHVPLHFCPNSQSLKQICASSTLMKDIYKPTTKARDFTPL